MSDKAPAYTTEQKRVCGVAQRCLLPVVLTKSCAQLLCTTKPVPVVTSEYVARARWSLGTMSHAMNQVSGIGASRGTAAEVSVSVRARTRRRSTGTCRCPTSPRRSLTRLVRVRA
jgi:hypothetical protein